MSLKTKYTMIEFKREGRTWRCYQEGDVLGDAVRNMTTGEWRFLSLGSVFLGGQMCMDIADFMEQLHKGEKPK